jgi:GNAT superfamily N-acetyltransferase
MIWSGRSDIEFRVVEPTDEPFLRRLYSSSRVELSLVGWSADQLEAFLSMQYGARERHYRERFPSGEDLLVLVGGKPGGRLWIVRAEDEVRIVDIALLPEHRGGGIGSALITGLQQGAAAADLPLVLHVEAGNRAANLYHRLGFVIDAGDGVYTAMRWRSQTVAAGSDR